MADPNKYTISYSFDGFQSSNPAVPLPGNQLDIQLAGIAASISELVDSIKDIRRSDGKLKNAVVTTEALAPAVAVELAGESLDAAITAQLVASLSQIAGLNFRGAYSGATAYAVLDVVRDQGSSWCCIAATTGNAPPTLPTATNTWWSLLAQKGTDGTSPDLNALVTKDSNTGAANLPVGTTAQRPAVPATGMVRWNTSIGRQEHWNGTLWGAPLLRENNLADLENTTAALTTLGFTAFTRDLIDSADAAAFLAALGYPIASQAEATAGVANDRFMTPVRVLQAINSAQVLPTGTIVPFAGGFAPSGWLFCAGQNVSRTTYATLYSVLGDVYGAGDGSTTFGLPDLRGRVIAGKDNMGGSTASRLTSPQVAGTTLGATGGAQTHTLTTAEIPAHTHSTGIYGSGATSPPAPVASSTTRGSTAYDTAANAGGGGAHNNVQPTFILNYVIKT